MKTKKVSVQGDDPCCPGAEMSIPWSWALGCCCVPARDHVLVLEKLAAVASWILVPPACQGFCGDRDRAGRREVTVGRMVLCRGGKKDGMSLEFGGRKCF